MFLPVTEKNSESSEKLNPVKYFSKSLHLEMFDRVRNMLLNWFRNVS